MNCSNYDTDDDDDDDGDNADVIVETAADY